MMGGVSKLLKRVARPERVELPTFWFVARYKWYVSIARCWLPSVISES